jgi:hypothetical protein
MMVLKMTRSRRTDVPARKRTKRICSELWTRSLDAVDLNTQGSVSAEMKTKIVKAVMKRSTGERRKLKSKVDA